MVRSKSKAKWLKMHCNDEYVKRAQCDGRRSRAAYKLLEIQEKYGLIRPGMCVVDLGAAPGSWSQVAADLVGANGKVLALDILQMESLAGVDFFQCDFTEVGIVDKVIHRLRGKRVDFVMSDMAPNISGIRIIDQTKAMYLAELAMDFAWMVLKPGGFFLSKVFQGAGMDELFKQVRQSFEKVGYYKPRASRSKSREIYLLGRSYSPSDLL